MLGVGWLLLLGSLGTSFTAQGRVNAEHVDTSERDRGALPLWLMIAGLAATAISLLF